jgi:predicted transcriptional regulator
MEVNMNVSEVMHRGVTTAQIDDSIKRIAAIMKKEDIGAIPIYKNQRPVGFVTDRDIVISCLANGQNPDTPVSQAMSRQIIFVREDQDIQEAIKLMENNQISRLLVVDKGETPVGMLTLQDILLHSSDEHVKADFLTKLKKS